MSKEKVWYSFDTRNISTFGKLLWTMVVLTILGITYEHLKAMDTRTMVFIMTLCFILIGLTVWVAQLLKGYGIIKCGSK